MRLDELKTGLIKQFFKSEVQGVHRDSLLPYVQALREQLTPTSTVALSAKLSEDGSNSNDPTKAFGMFVKGREAVLSIMADSGIQQRSIYTAARIGRSVSAVNLSEGDGVVECTDLAGIKQALKQARAIDDEIYFNVIHWE